MAMTARIWSNGPGRSMVERKSNFTGQTHSMAIPLSPDEISLGLASDPMIQDAFPTLSADEREFLLTGTTPEEWNKMFPPGDDETLADLDEGEKR